MSIRHPESGILPNRTKMGKSGQNGEYTILGYYTPQVHMYFDGRLILLPEARDERDPAVLPPPS
jgi:hypothetical protein